MTEQSSEGAIRILDELRIDAKLGKSKHFSASRRKITTHNWLGIPVIVINIFIGTVIFTFLLDGNEKNYFNISAAVAAFIAASMSAVQTFFNYHKTAEGHSSVGNRYLKVSRSCKMLLRKHQDIPFTPDALWSKAEAIQQEYLDINNEAEAFPTNNKDLRNARAAKEITPFLLNNDKTE